MHTHMHSSVGTIIVSQNHSITKNKGTPLSIAFARVNLTSLWLVGHSRLFPLEVARLHDARNGHSPAKAWWIWREECFEQRRHLVQQQDHLQLDHPACRGRGMRESSWERELGLNCWTENALKTYQKTNQCTVHFNLPAGVPAPASTPSAGANQTSRSTPKSVSNDLTLGAVKETSIVGNGKVWFVEVCCS